MCVITGNTLESGETHGNNNDKCYKIDSEAREQKINTLEHIKSTFWSVFGLSEIDRARAREIIAEIVCLAVCARGF